MKGGFYMYKVVGTEIKSGNFNKDGKNILYNNLYLYCIGDSITPIYKDGVCKRFAFGNKIDTIKIKNDNDILSSVFNHEVTDEFISDLVGSDIELFYNRYGGISAIKVV